MDLSIPLSDKATAYILRRLRTSPVPPIWQEDAFQDITLSLCRRPEPDGSPGMLRVQSEIIRAIRRYAYDRQYNISRGAASLDALEADGFRPKATRFENVSVALMDLRDATGALNQRQSQFIALTAIGLTSLEIGARLGLPSNYIRNEIADARKRLRERTQIERGTLL